MIFLINFDIGGVAGRYTMANCSGHQVKADQREVLSEKETNFGKTATFSGDGEGGLLGNINSILLLLCGPIELLQ